MIDPKTLNLSQLPWLPLESRNAFPVRPAIYFAIDFQDSIQYIGISNNPRQRWAQHHRFEQLAALDGVKIAYLFVDEPSLLKPIEEALIAWFDPPLNVIGKSLGQNGCQRPDDWIHGEKKGGRQFMLTDSVSATIDALAKELGISRSEVVERTFRCGGGDAAKKFNPQTGSCDRQA